MNPSEPAAPGSGTGSEPAIRRDGGGRFTAGGASANPGGRPRRGPDASAISRAAVESVPGYRFDGWTSLLMGIGTRDDKRESLFFQPDVVTWEGALNIWRGDDLAARIIETMPNEMVREGADILVTTAKKGSPDKGRRRASMRERVDNDDTKALQEIVENKWTELDMWGALYDGLTYENAYGGGAVLIGANDGNPDLSEPLNLERVRSLDFLTALEPRELSPCAWYGNPQGKMFGKPAVYQINPMNPGISVDGKSYASTIRVHESRLIIFPGIRVTRQEIGALGGWGDSVLTRVYRVLRDFNLSWSSAAALVADFAQAVYKMKGLNELLVEDPKDLFKNRMRGMELSRSIARAVMIDGDDEFERKQTPVSGLPDLLDRFAKRLGSAADMPLQMLMGESPGGMNASGASGDQVRIWYDRVRARQNRKLQPAVRKITQILLRCLGKEPAAWSIRFRNLWQPTEAETLTNRKTQMEIDSGYLDRGVYTASVCAEQRFGGDAYSSDTHIDPADTAELDPAAVAAYAAEEGAARPGQPAGPVVAAAPGTDIQKEALNGAQISSLIEVLAAVNEKRLSRESGRAVLMLAFQLEQAGADALLGPKFEVTPPPVAAPAGFGAPAVKPAPFGEKKPEPAGDE